MEKSKIHNRIIHLRKSKGITQESLSEKTGLNVRTIQRIESGEVDPRLYTLKLIANALEVDLEELLPNPSQNDLNQIALLHLTPAGFFLLPAIGNLLIPFIYLILKKEQINGINKHGVDILNGQMTYSIVVGIALGLKRLLEFTPMFYPNSHWVERIFRHYPLYLSIGTVLSIIVFAVFPGVNAFRVYSRQNAFKYPFQLKIFK